MSTQIIKKPAVDCFGVPLKTINYQSAEVSQKYLERTKPVFNPAIGAYEFVDDEPLDLDEVIQSYKDDCGMEIAKRMIARGEDISCFADDGKHSADLSGISVELVDSQRNQAKQAEVIAKIAQALGISINDDDTLEDTIKNAIEAKTVKEPTPNE